MSELWWVCFGMLVFWIAISLIVLNTKPVPMERSKFAEALDELKKMSSKAGKPRR